MTTKAQSASDPVARLRRLVSLDQQAPAAAPVQILGSEPRLPGAFRLTDR